MAQSTKGLHLCSQQAHRAASQRGHGCRNTQIARHLHQLHHHSRESHRPLTPILLKSIAIHLPFLSRYLGKSMPSSWQKAVYTPPLCITIHLRFVSRYSCRSTRVRGRWDTPKIIRAHLINCTECASHWGKHAIDDDHSDCDDHPFAASHHYAS